MKKTLALVFVCLLFAPFLVGAEDGNTKQFYANFDNLFERKFITLQFVKKDEVKSSVLKDFIGVLLDGSEKGIPLGAKVILAGHADSKKKKGVKENIAQKINFKWANKRRNVLENLIKKYRRDLRVVVDDRIEPSIQLYNSKTSFSDAKIACIHWYVERDNTALLVQNMQKQVVETNAAQSKFLESIAEEVKSLKTAKAYNPQPGQQQILAGINSVSLNQSRMLKSIKKTITIAVVVVMALLFVLVFLLLQSNNKQEELPRVEKISHEEIPQMQRKSIPVAVASKPPVYAAELELKDRIIIAKLPIDKNGLVPHPIMEDKSYAGNKLKELNKSLKTALEQYYRYERETKNIEDGIQEEYLKTTQHFLDRKWGQTISQLFNDNVFVVKEKK